VTDAEGSIQEIKDRLAEEQKEETEFQVTLVYVLRPHLVYIRGKVRGNVAMPTVGKLFKKLCFRAMESYANLVIGTEFKKT